jgi:hypothetical protein
VPVKVACVYPDGVLAGDWFQFVRRLRSQVARARIDARIRLVRASAVPGDADVVVAPVELARAAWAPARPVRLVTVGPGEAQQVLADLLERLRREAATGGDDGRAPRTVVRRGFEVVEWTGDIG